MELNTAHRFSPANFDSEDEEDFDDCNTSDDDATYGNNTFHPLLEEDIERVKLEYGSEAISHMLYSVIDSVDLDLAITTQILDREIALAWRIKHEEPIIVRLHLSLTDYLDGEVPMIDVLQQSEKQNCGVRSQMKSILENFLSKEWKNLSNDIVKSHVTTGMTVQEEMFTSEAVAKIVEMGFPADKARNALVMCKYDTVEAINLLTAEYESCTYTRMSPAPTKKTVKCEKTLTMSSLLGSFTAQLFGKSLDPSRNPKQHPGLDKGFLVMIMRYVYQRLPTLNEFCVVCDDHHVFEGGAMLKPTVCSRDLCIFSFLSLGVMSDAANIIATEPDVVNLLVVMANAACRSPRRDLIFDPYPVVPDPMKHNKMALSPEVKDFVKVQTILDNFLPINKMVSLYGTELKKEMDKKDRLSYPLLEWIISSNRSRIVKLPVEKQLDFMQTPHQFLLLSSPPAKEVIFNKARAEYGSTFAFHGSPLENWHSIIRQGLINASGTIYQMNRAAYGKGIYLSPDANLSFGYSGISKVVTLVPARASSKRVFGGSNLRCVALCEVVLNGLQKKNSRIWVMPEPDYVCTRFFFVYENDQTSDSAINTTQEWCIEKIKKAMQFHAH